MEALPWVCGTVVFLALAAALVRYFAPADESASDIIGELDEMGVSQASVKAENGSRVRFRTRPDPAELVQVVAVNTAQGVPAGVTVLLAGGGTPAPVPPAPPAPTVTQPGGPTTAVVVTIPAGAVWLQCHSGGGYGPIWRVAPGATWSPPVPPAPGSTVFVRVSADATNWSPEATHVVA